MVTQVEELDGDRVRLTIEVPAEDVQHAVAHATSDLAATVKVPGFRNGKVPPAVLVQRIGKERLYTEAVESHIGSWFWNAATQTRVQAVQQQLEELQRIAAEVAPVEGRPVQEGDVAIVDLVADGVGQRDLVVDVG